MHFLLLAAAFGLPLPFEFIALNSTAGFELLVDAATLRTSYMQAINHFVSQQDGGSCFRASATIVLNAMSMHGVEPPVQPGTFWRPETPGYWVQDNVVNNTCATSNCTGPYPHCIGASLKQASRALACTGVNVTALHARDASLATAADFATLLEANLGTEGSHVVINFIGTPMDGLDHGGHYSPVVAYHPTRGMALVLDVSRYKYPPWWVPIATLWKGIDSLDSKGTRRGLMVVRPTA